MSSYTVRVELHDAVWSDYERLHGEMKARGFARTITADNGTVYDLPPAEYNYEGSAVRSEVLEKAKAAARAVKPSYEVLVTESAGRTWHGLNVRTKAA